MWDARGAKNKPVMDFVAQADEVNAVSWNAIVPHLVASGAENGVWKVHDLRKVGDASAGSADVFSFAFHRESVTSIEWCPFEDSMLAVVSADDSISVWDLSATVDDDVALPVKGEDEFVDNVPEQLLFLHRGVTDPKVNERENPTLDLIIFSPSLFQEVKWHKQIPGLMMATASNGFHIFAPDNVVPP